MTLPAQRRAHCAGMTATSAARRRTRAGTALATLTIALAAGIATFALLEGSRTPPAPRPATAVSVAPYIDGISDQNVPYWNGRVWSGGPADSPFGRFVAAALVNGATGAPTTAQPLRYARYVVAYDVMCDTTGPAFATFARWLADVERLDLKPDVTFWYGDFDGNSCPLLPLIPRSAATYAGPVAAFLARFPQVATIEPWNEPNDGHGPDVQAQTAAAFWLAVHADCATRACDAVIAGDFNDAARNLVAYERRYVATLGGAAATDWGVHPYAAVNHERETTLLEFEAGLPDRRADRVWYTEIGAFYCTRKQNPETGYSDARLQDLQERRAHYLVSTLMAYPFAPTHVFYYEFMYKDDLPGPCVTDDSALFAPTAPGAPVEYAPRAAVQDIFPFAAPAPPTAPAARTSVFYPAVDWRPWRDGPRVIVLPAIGAGTPG
jgi:hypothetical protein